MAIRRVSPSPIKVTGQRLHETLVLATAPALSAAGTVARSGLHRTALWRLLWPGNGAGSRIPALDGLRAIAVLLTMLYHSWRWMPGMLQPGQQATQYPINYGRTGVHLFFVLSGFLLFLPYARWLFGLQGRPAVLKFYKRRILRVGPAYWITLAILVLTGPITLPALGDALAHVAFVANAFPDSIYSINGVFWTMAIEVQFYALLPALGWAAGALSRRVGPGRAALCIVLALPLVAWTSDLLARNTDLGRLPVIATAVIGQPGLAHWLGVFGAGIACSIAYVFLTQVPRRRPRQRRRLALYGSTALAMGVALGVTLAWRANLQDISIQGNLLFGWAYAAVLFGLLFGPSILRRPFESRLLQFIGLISYSLYLWHTVVLSRVEPYLVAVLPLPQERVAAGFALGVLLSLPIAYLSFQLAERPFFRARQRAHGEPETAAA